ncbi:MAG: DUF927 domain-containing protein [Enterobacterales bacterium]|uniref:Zinc-binding domain of primase-helicase n=2 Tax=Hafnia alvei TaxID=569 RepID=G9Y692_HAFAL|nr:MULTISPECIES: TOPRIM and DUF927 domain-containing protein [Hafnia]MDN6087702.1 DUF927 domain-containing protein [Enterobacterales bacterium]TBL49659.1 DUF927 domain-containing protein [Obesumbacterium proteus]EHM42950.1 Zinc-binding domain of primase-helicase [Hafnia alvei ATCC 51873]KFC88053.1 DNA primase [Hafnia alvei ATCC 13337]MDX6841066.1 DUF927 domain-containing protein [Hafnia paralvei]
MRNIDLIREVTAAATNRWPEILDFIGVNVPASPRTHTACPACGGKDRFRFDDNGRGSHFCNQCGAGDGLDLIAKVRCCDITTAAQLAADALGIDYRTAKMQEVTSQRKSLSATKGQKSALDQEQHTKFADRYRKLGQKVTFGESPYLQSKGLEGFTFSILPDGGLLLPLRDESGEVVAAQTISPSGEKRLIAGSAKKGSFYTINAVETPPYILIAEGLATALSVHLMRPDALTVAAIDAGNLLPVAQVLRVSHPDAQIIIAADNDLAEGAKNVGIEHAEKAALAVAGWVSAPPTDKKADWDDYRQQHGLEAAAKAFASALYQPQADIQSEPTKGHKENDLKPYVDKRREGLYWIEPKLDNSTNEILEKESWLSTLVNVVGVGEDDAERYLILAWTPEGTDKERIEAIPLRDIGEKEGWARMKSGGMLITAKSGLRSLLADHLQRSGNRELWSIANATGWQYGAYIMPDASIIGRPERPVLFNGRSAAAKGYCVKGTVESWKGSVAKLAYRNPSMMLGIACALSAPLIGLAGADGFGVHLFGGSSAGKTTTANAASSVYGEPDALKLTWYSTALGLVNEAAAHNDGFMPLDEIGQGGNRRAVAESAYALFNGVGKIQGAKEGGNRDLKRWRAMAFSTGEIDLESYIRADGGKINAGQLVRLLNVPISKATEFHGYADGKAHADAMKDGYQNNFGAIGRKWIAYLAEHRDQAVKVVRDSERRWLSLLPPEASEQVRRVASRFAILDAALRLSSDLTGWDESVSHDALLHSFNAWVSEFGMGNREAKAWVEQATAFLQQFGLSRYLPYPDSDPRDLPIKNLAGYRVTNRVTDVIAFHTWPTVFKDEIAAGANYTAFAQALADAGMLDKPSKGISKKTLSHGGKQCRFVVLSLPIDDSDDEEND